MRLIYPFALLMICSYLADMMGLATIVGAFAAGLIIREEDHSTCMGNVNDGGSEYWGGIAQEYCNKYGRRYALFTLERAREIHVLKQDDFKFSF